MQFSYSPHMQTTFPRRVTGVIALAGIDSGGDVAIAAAALRRKAADRLSTATEADFPEIKAWRAVYAVMGLKPTRYRCAAEALLRRFRKDGCLPVLHPLIELCNAVSLAFAVPVAVFDLRQIDGDLVVREAIGNESYLTFAGETEHPEPREIIFADDAGNAHARRWANRQSRLSAVSAGTQDALIVAEALHEGAAADLQRLVIRLEAELPRLVTHMRSTILDTPDAAFNLQSKAGG
jgi:DNA/RNA-binding domain of Phe-tRNA-synthetase-like protein